MQSMKEKIRNYFSFHGVRAILTLQEAYSAILPYLLLISFVSMAMVLMRFLHIENPFMDAEYLRTILGGLDLFSSIVIVIAVAYFFAQRYHLSSIIASTLAIAAYATVMITEESGASFMFGYTHGFAVQTLVVPFASTLMLHFFYPRLSLRIPLRDHNRHIYEMFNYLYAFIAAYLLLVIGYEAADLVLDQLGDVIEEAMEEVAIPPLIEIALREVWIDLFWFVGVHGDYTVQSIVGKSLYTDELFPGLTAGEFVRLFVTPGGAGAGAGMLIALLITAKKGMLRTISRLSIPLVAFNINTLLIYAIVVFNPYFLVAFVLIPLLNLLFAYAILTLDPIVFQAGVHVTDAPLIINAYLKSGGNGHTVVLQLLIIAIDSLLYTYVARRYFRSQSHASQVLVLERALQLPETIRADAQVRSFQAKRHILSSSVQLDRVLSQINEDNMMVYFQPKISLEDGSCTHVEALLRYRNIGGKIAFPGFMPLIEEAGLSPVIDAWVAQEVKRIMDVWARKHRFRPTVSINLHPDTLASSSALEGILSTLGGEAVVFEIVERSFAGNEKVLAGLHRIQEHGFEIAIDDYGVGYSNLEAVITHNINEIKLDKVLLDRLEQKKGRIVYEHIVQLGRDLGLRVVAEGVETLEQVETLMQMHVDIVQGFYFSRAIPAKDVPDFVRSFDPSNYLSGWDTVCNAG